MMKSVVFSLLAVLMVLAGPVAAQTSPVPKVSDDPTLSPAPMQQGAAAVLDPEVEVAFWDTVKDSDDPMLYLAYLEQYPDGAFRVIARNRLEDLWDRAVRAFALLEEMGVSLDAAPGTSVAPPPAVTPAPVTVNPVIVNPPIVNPPIVVTPSTKPAPAVPTLQLIRNSQNQLRKQGCYKGKIDGVWGPDSRQAMRRFNRKAGTTFPVVQPSQKALAHMRGLTNSGVQICR